MTTAEAETRLALVRTAINDAISAGGVASYSINGRSLQRSLEWLTREEQRLEQIIARGTTGGWFAGQFRRPE